MKPRARIRPFTLARRLTAIGFLALLMLGGRAGWSWLQGTTSATTAFETVPFVDPLAALEVSLATRAWLPEVWLGAGLLILLALLLGPVFCGWLCPLGLVLDLGQSLRGRLDRRLHRRALRLPELGLPRSTRLLVLGLALGFSLSARLPLFQTLSPIQAVTRALVLAADTALVAVAGLFLIELLLAPRVWCRAACPLGGLYSLLGRFAPLRVRVAADEERGLACRLCTRSCPMGIRVMEDYTLAGKRWIDDPDCTRCGACIDACPRDVLRICPEDGRRSASPDPPTPDHGPPAAPSSSARLHTRV